MVSSIIQFSVIILNLALGILILSHNSKSTSNRLFSTMSFFAAFWTFSNYMSDATTSLIWMKSSYALGALVISMGLIWTLSITDNKLVKRKYVPIILIALFFCVGSYFSNFIVESYYKNSLGSIPFGNPGWGLVLYTLYYFVAALLIVWKLYKAKVDAKDKTIRKQFHNIYYGALITLLVTLVSSFILPYFSIFPFGGIDNAGFLIFLSFIAYSITRHQLFNIKVIAIQLANFVLWTIIVLHALFAETSQEIVLDGVLLAVTMIFGIILIRSVFHEIRQREKMEKLTAELHKVYSQLNELNNYIDARPRD